LDPIFLSNCDRFPHNPNVMSANDHNDRDNDPVWTLVDQARTAKAGPLFARNVMREIRLGEQSPTPWWKRLIAPVPLTAGALAATAFAILMSIDRPEPPTAPVADFDLDQSLLIVAAEDPSLFSDEELLALLY